MLDVQERTREPSPKLDGPVTVAVIFLLTIAALGWLGIAAVGIYIGGIVGAAAMVGMFVAAVCLVAPDLVSKGRTDIGGERRVRIAAWVAIAALGLNVVYAAMESVALFRLRSLSSAQLEMIADIESLFGPMLFVTAAVFISWAYLAHTHLAEVGRPHVWFSDEGAVWWWFAPFGSLVLPFQVMYETARGSLVEFTDAQWDQHRVPRIAVWWTVMFYVGWLGIWGSERLLESAETTQQVDLFAAVNGIAYLLFGAAAMITIAMILQITEAEEDPSVAAVYGSAIEHAEPPAPGS